VVRGPQWRASGSVINPLLFLPFVQDLPDWIMVSILMFADDTKLWSKISQESDSLALQQALDKLVEWTKLWGMRFNIDKCKVMHVGHDISTKYLMQVNREVHILHMMRGASGS
jgi:Reverse transcriptase (RNA-dependent DNA polymerase)